MNLLEAREQITAVLTALDEGGPIKELDPAVADGLAVELYGSLSYTLGVLGRLEERAAGAKRRCCHCGGPMPKGRAPQARYCARSCRQRAYEARNR